MKALRLALPFIAAALLVPGLATAAAALHVSRTDVLFGGVPLALEAGPHSVFATSVGDAPLDAGDTDARWCACERTDAASRSAIRRG